MADNSEAASGVAQNDDVEAYARPPRDERHTMDLDYEAEEDDSLEPGYRAPPSGEGQPWTPARSLSPGLDIGFRYGAAPKKNLNMSIRSNKEVSEPKEKPTSPLPDQVAQQSKRKLDYAITSLDQRH